MVINENLERKIIPIASGKGGVGKTIIAANLALELAAQVGEPACQLSPLRRVFRYRLLAVRAERCQALHGDDPGEGAEPLMGDAHLGEVASHLGTSKDRIELGQDS